MILPIASVMDRAGFKVIDLTGSSIFEVLIKRCREDPWEGLRLIRAAMPNSKLRSAVRSNGTVTFGLTPSSVIDLWVQTLCRNGINSFWIYDTLFNIDKIGRIAKVAKANGAQAIAAIMYTLSPVHTDDYYAEKAGRLAALDVDGLYIEDTAGVLTPERARTLIPAIQSNAEGLPIEMHFHNPTGLAPLCYIEGIRLGVTTIHTASRPLANGPSLPSTESMVENIRRLGHSCDLDQEGLKMIADHFSDVAAGEGLPVGIPAEFELSTYDHQLPGGMMGTLLNQLRDRGMESRIDEVLEEAGIIRCELGYPPMATPLSQIVGIQAVLNLTTAERYEVVPDELLMYALGHYGEVPGEIDPNVLEKIMSSHRARELSQSEPYQPTIDEIRRTIPHTSDEDLLLRVLVPDEDIHAMLQSGPIRTNYKRPSSPEIALVQALLQEDRFNYLSLQREGLLVSLGKRSSHGTPSRNE